MSISIHNKKVNITIDRASGQFLSLAQGDVSYGFADKGFSLIADGALYFENASAESMAFTKNGVEFLYRDGDYTAKLRYILPENGAFVERELAFRKNKGEWNADKIVCENFSLAADEILFHDDQSPWECEVCLYQHGMTPPKGLACLRCRQGVFSCTIPFTGRRRRRVHGPQAGKDQHHPGQTSTAPCLSIRRPRH